MAQRDDQNSYAAITKRYTLLTQHISVFRMILTTKTDSFTENNDGPGHCNGTPLCCLRRRNVVVNCYRKCAPPVIQYAITYSKTQPTDAQCYCSFIFLFIFSPTCFGKYPYHYQGGCIKLHKTCMKYKVNIKC
jgi:hypothetical protein